jgi:hypothetical protein
MTMLYFTTGPYIPIPQVHVTPLPQDHLCPCLYRTFTNESITRMQCLASSLQTIKTNLSVQVTSEIVMDRMTVTVFCCDSNWLDVRNCTKTDQNCSLMSTVSLSGAAQLSSPWIYLLQCICIAGKSFFYHLIRITFCALISILISTVFHFVT